RLVKVLWQSEIMSRFKTALVFLFVEMTLFAQRPARIDILLPERTRLLAQQRIDLVIEAPNASAGQLTVKANGQDITSRFAAPIRTELDCDGSDGMVFRAAQYEFQRPGSVKLTVELQTSGETLRTERTLEIKPFDLPQKPRNYVIFVGDAMGNA